MNISSILFEKYGILPPDPDGIRSLLARETLYPKEKKILISTPIEPHGWMWYAFTTSMEPAPGADKQ